MPNPNSKRLIRQTLYDLKHRFGEQVTVYSIVDSNTDYQTGEKSISTTSRLVKRCIVLPADEALQILQAVNYISASKAFTSLGGGLWDSSKRVFIFDGMDVPSFNLTDYIVFDDARYDTESIEALTGNSGFLVVAKHVQGQPSGGVAVVNVAQATGFNQSAGGLNES